MGAHPSSDFYWADWENEPTLKLASLAAQGLWVRICARAHHSPVRGYALNPDGSTPSLSDWATLVGKPAAELEPLIAELQARTVCDVDEETGAIVCRRMLKEEAKKADREARRAERQAAYQDVACASIDISSKLEMRRAADRERQRRRRAKGRDSSVTVPVTVTGTPAEGHVTVTRDDRDAEDEKTTTYGEPSCTRARISSFLLPPSKNPLPEESSPVPLGAPLATLTGGGAPDAANPAKGMAARIAANLEAKRRGADA